MGVSSIDFKMPEGKFTTLLKRILISLGFHDGFLYLECSVEVALKWFHQVIPVFFLWPIALINHCEFRVAEDGTCRWKPADLLSMLDEQNPGIDFGHFKVKLMNARNDKSTIVERFQLVVFETARKLLKVFRDSHHMMFNFLLERLKFNKIRKL